MSSYSVIIILMLQLGLMKVSSQTDSSLSFLSVESSAEGVCVYDDTVLIGKTPLSFVAIQPGVHILRYIQEDMRNWLHFPIVETVYVKERETVTRRVAFPFVYYLTSEPFNAEVFLDDKFIGRTPYILSLDSSARTISIKKSGYQETEILLTPGVTKIHCVLAPNPGNEITGKYLFSEVTQSNTTLYVSMAAVVACGASAAYFKVKADDMYVNYKKTGDKELLRKVNRYDTVSGVALAVSKISLIFFTYVLLSH